LEQVAQRKESLFSQVTNLGRPLKTFGTASLDIQWPKEISNGKWLLYLMKIESKGLEKVSCQPQNEINVLHVAVCYPSYLLLFTNGFTIKTAQHAITGCKSLPPEGIFCLRKVISMIHIKQYVRG